MRTPILFALGAALLAAALARASVGDAVVVAATPADAPVSIAAAPSEGVITLDVLELI